MSYTGFISTDDSRCEHLRAPDFGYQQMELPVV
jgi:hypothetical protein